MLRTWNLAPRVADDTGFVVHVPVRFTWSEHVNDFQAGFISASDGAKVVNGPIDVSSPSFPNTFQVVIELTPEAAAAGEWTPEVVVKIGAARDDGMNWSTEETRYRTTLASSIGEGIGGDGGSSGASEGGSPFPPPPFTAKATKQGKDEQGRDQILLEWKAAKPNDVDKPIRFYMVIFRDKGDYPGDGKPDCEGGFNPKPEEDPLYPGSDWRDGDDRSVNASNNYGERVTRRIGKTDENELAFRRTCRFNTLIPVASGKETPGETPYSVRVPAKAYRAYRIRACSAPADVLTGFTGCVDSQEFWWNASSDKVEFATFKFPDDLPESRYIDPGTGKPGDVKFCPALPASSGRYDPVVNMNITYIPIYDRPFLYDQNGAPIPNQVGGVELSPQLTPYLLDAEGGGTPSCPAE